jgi:hypothetical protein
VLGDPEKLGAALSAAKEFSVRIDAKFGKAVETAETPEAA